MKILDRVEQLIALTSSPNEHEARNAAFLAAQLIRKHRIVLSLPAGEKTRTRAKSDPGIRPDHEDDSPRSGRGKHPRSSKGVKRVVDPPERIVAPLGGECVHCGARYRADATVYWFRSGGGMHVKCFEEWSRR